MIKYRLEEKLIPYLNDKNNCYSRYIIYRDKFDDINSHFRYESFPICIESNKYIAEELIKIFEENEP